jgi:exonuclease SbcC
MEAEIAALRAAMEAGSAVVAKAKRLDAEIADWTLLAMGLRGVIDLSIEDAGPAISAIANDLLNTAYGPRFTLRIVTQREQANGKTVETFDVSVIDAESDMESSILQKSGGEAVILDRCLTDACAIFQQDAIGMAYETAFADEADGALSADNREMFLNMERRAMTLGNYGRKYFVSHSPAAWEMADYVLDLAEYRRS